MQESMQEGTPVAKDSHVVPKGVAVEELKNFGGHKDLVKECPPDVKALMEKKGLVDTYDKMVLSVADESGTRSAIGKWRDMEFVAVIDQFRDDFAEKGVKVALCKRRSGSGAHRWLEFIDVDVTGDYVPQYDVANLSGQVIKTVYTKLEFPNGVAVEELKRYGKARQRLKEKMPIFVEKMISEKDLTAEYNALVDHIVEANQGKKWANWDISKVKGVVNEHAYKFEKKDVAVFVSHKQEYISHGQYGGHMEYFRWLEFVDRKEQPNYHPQRDAESKKEKCIIS